MDGLIWEEIGTDYEETDGWSVEWNTMVIPNGPYFLRVSMVDWADNEGSTQIMVNVINI